MLERPLATTKMKPILQTTFGQPMKGPSLDRLNKKPGAGLSLQPLQSLLSNFRFTSGSLFKKRAESFNLALVAEGKYDFNVRGTIKMSNISTCMKEEVANVRASMEEDVDGFIKMNDELPYSSISIIGDEKNLQDDESSSLSSPSYLSESFLSQIDSRWSDTNSFGSKKIKVDTISNFELDASNVLSMAFFSSGESGACKMKTTNIAKQYLAALGAGTGMEYENFQTNPILEIFENVETIRNDNSSRFVSFCILLNIFKK
ncbi:hypothetical protein MA16_Dca013533 [Dendrobium catenatum]|uniref:Myosin motor domain-containing protein n=1 Tax=Dendrobium catenatum TaxID=906689 RepID=A0A2I0VPQ0_9ASPA|nr:hypothetical protein MA16_Dca013533 [Dendrobium catenatum]